MCLCNYSDAISIIFFMKYSILNLLGLFSGLGDGIDDFPLFSRIYYAIYGCGMFELFVDFRLVA